MSNGKLLLLGIVFITGGLVFFLDISMIGFGAASDVPFVFSGSTSNVAVSSSDQIKGISQSNPDLSGVPAVSTPSDNLTLNLPVVGGGRTPQGMIKKKVSELKSLFNSRVEPDYPTVHETAVDLTSNYPGDYTVDQVSAIFSEMVENWRYIGDPRGVNDFFYANETLKRGDKAKCVGAGDCGDFAILMSALVESIGGTTRIVLANNNTTGGHAYAEVYLGRDDISNSQAEGVIRWLEKEFVTDKIYTNIDTDTKDVWLNLDWWPDQSGNPHPGGPFFTGDKNIVLHIRENYPRVPLSLPGKKNKPPKLISLTPDKPSPQDAGATITWTAEAKDPDKDQILYRFFLNDNPVTEWITDNTWVWNTTNDYVGENQIEVRVRDGTYGHALPNGFDDRRTDGFNITVPETRPIAPLNVTRPIAPLNVTRPVINASVAVKPSPMNVTEVPRPKSPMNKTTPTLKIEYPSNGSVVSTQERLTGVAKNIPVDKEGWVIVFTYSTQLYYPQGPIRPDINGNWSFVSNIGSENDLGRKFDLVLLLADNQAMDKFYAYFRNVSLRGWEGMNKLPDHTEEYHRITVIRGGG